MNDCENHWSPPYQVILYVDDDSGICISRVNIIMVRDVYLDYRYEHVLNVRLDT